MTVSYRAPRGSKLTCANWQIEAAYRMVQNNLDAEVAEDPERLIVYGGSGKAARNPEALQKILATLRRLQPTETMLVQSGKGGGSTPLRRVWFVRLRRGVFPTPPPPRRGCCWPTPTWWVIGPTGTSSAAWSSSG